MCSMSIILLANDGDQLEVVFMRSCAQLWWVQRALKLERSGDVLGEIRKPCRTAVLETGCSYYEPYCIGACCVQVCAIMWTPRAL